MIRGAATGQTQDTHTHTHAPILSQAALASEALHVMSCVVWDAAWDVVEHVRAHNYDNTAGPCTHASCCYLANIHTRTGPSDCALLQA
jgi:hypothetical protein